MLVRSFVPHDLARLAESDGVIAGYVAWTVDPAETVVIGTGGDSIHAPARAPYEWLGCTMFPVAVYYRQL